QRCILTRRLTKRLGPDELAGIIVYPCLHQRCATQVRYLSTCTAVQVIAIVLAISAGGRIRPCNESLTVMLNRVDICDWRSGLRRRTRDKIDTKQHYDVLHCRRAALMLCISSFPIRALPSRSGDSAALAH